MGAVVGGALLLLRGASPWSLLGGAAAALLLWWAVQLLEWAWWTPRPVDRALRAQSLSGTRYRFLWGDIKEDQRLTAAALARPVPMDRPHDFLPRVAPLLHRVFQQHGKLPFIWFGPSPRVTINDPVLVRDVLSNKSGDFAKSELATRLSRSLFGGLVVLDGEKWVKHRRILNPAFHAEKLKGMLPAFTASCTELIDRWENLVAASVGRAELDVWPEFQNLSGDVISRALFGVSYEEGRRIFLLQAELAERVVRSFRTNYIPGFSYGSTLMIAVMIMSKSDCSYDVLICRLFFSTNLLFNKSSYPYYRFSLLPTENNRRMKAIDKEVKKIIRGIIERRQDAMRNGEATKEDLLGLLLESNMKYSDLYGKSSKGITVEEVIDECKVFYFAGVETTAVLLAWTVVVLSMHPEWQIVQERKFSKSLGKMHQISMELPG